MLTLELCSDEEHCLHYEAANLYSGLRQLRPGRRLGCSCNTLSPVLAKKNHAHADQQTTIEVDTDAHDAWTSRLFCGGKLLVI